MRTVGLARDVVLLVLLLVGLPPRPVAACTIDNVASLRADGSPCADRLAHPPTKAVILASR